MNAGDDQVEQIRRVELRLLAEFHLHVRIARDTRDCEDQWSGYDDGEDAGDHHTHRVKNPNPVRPRDGSGNANQHDGEQRERELIRVVQQRRDEHQAWGEQPGGPAPRIVGKDRRQHRQRK
jgi:hypothetical protein